MRPVLFDAALGRSRDLAPSEPARLGLASALDVPPEGAAFVRRQRALAVLTAALSDWGFSVEPRAERPDVCFGGKAVPRALWLKPGRGPDEPLAQARARSFSDEDLAYWSLRRRYREDATLDWDELAACRDERRRLAGVAQSLARTHGSAAPNPAGLAGYRQRLRRALMDDLDTSEALATLWDALRPGALSPGSQLAALKLADAALALSLPF